VHSAAFLSAHRRGHAGFARTRFGATSPARQHRARITWMIARHLFPRALAEPEHVPVRR
jgi:hypothetical protein